MVDKLGLKKITNPTLYRATWLQEGHQVLVNENARNNLRLGHIRIKFYEMLCLGMLSMFCWVGHGSSTGR